MRLKLHGIFLLLISGVLFASCSGAASLQSAGSSVPQIPLDSQQTLSEAAHSGSLSEPNSEAIRFPYEILVLERETFLGTVTEGACLRPNDLVSWDATPETLAAASYGAETMMKDDPLFEPYRYVTAASGAVSVAPPVAFHFLDFNLEMSVTYEFDEEGSLEMVRYHTTYPAQQRDAFIAKLQQIAESFSAEGSLSAESAFTAPTEIPQTPAIFSWNCLEDDSALKMAYSQQRNTLLLELVLFR